MSRITMVMLATVVVASCKSNSSGGVDTTTYTVQVTTAPPAAAPVSSAVPIAVTVMKQVNGGTATPAAGVSATLAVTGGGGSVTPNSITTGSDGTVSATWTLGSTTGVQTLRISVSTTDYVDVDVTATALPANQLSITTQPATTAIAGQPLTGQPVVQLRDARGQEVPQSGVVVTASIASGGGTLGGATTATTDASGVATFTGLSLSAAGSITLRFTATLNGQSVSVTSSAVTVSPPNQLAVLTPSSASVHSAIPFFVQPVIQLQDGQGNALHQAGVAVTASAATGGATLGVATGGTGTLTVTTDASGQAAFHDLMLTGTGASTIQFTSPGLTVATSATLNVSATTSTSIANAIAAGPVSAAANTQTYYMFTVPAGTTSIDVSTYGSTGNIELYARPGAYPTAADFVCHSNVPGPAQVCSITTNLTGIWYLAVNAAAAYTGSNVVAYAYTAACIPAPLTIGVTVTGTVTSNSCRVELGGASSEDKYTFIVTTPEIVTFTSTANGTNQLLVYRQGTPRNGVEAATSSFSVTQPYLLGAGTYIVGIIDLQPGTPPPALNYTITATATPAEPNGCKFLIGGGASSITLNLMLKNTDCTGTTAGTFSHRIDLFVGAGQTVTATMASTAFDPFLKIESPPTTLTTGTSVLASDNNSGGGTTARVSYTNPSTAADATGIMVEATSATAGGVGAYTLTLTIAPDFPDIVAPPTLRLQPGAVTAKHPKR